MNNTTQKRALRNHRQRPAEREPEAQTGGILEALRRSPLVGADLEIKRVQGIGRYDRRGNRRGKVDGD